MSELQERLPSLSLTELEELHRDILSRLEQSSNPHVRRALVCELGLVAEWMVFRYLESRIRRSSVPVKIRHATGMEDRREGFDLEIVLADHVVRLDITISEAELEKKWASASAGRGVLPVKINPRASAKMMTYGFVEEMVRYLPRDLVVQLAGAVK